MNFFNRTDAQQAEADSNVQGLQDTTATIEATNAQLEVMSSRWETVAAAAGKAAAEATEFQMMIESTKVDAIAGLATSFGALSAGLALGTSGFDEFAAAALQSLSQIAAQWGALLLAYGFGVSKVPGLNIGSGAAIAGGTALLAVAGAAGVGAAALSGGGGGSAGGGSGTASVPSSIEGRGLFSTQRDSGPNTTEVHVYLDGDEMTPGFAKIVNRAARLGQLQLAGAR